MRTSATLRNNASTRAARALTAIGATLILGLGACGGGSGSSDGTATPGDGSANAVNDAESLLSDDNDCVAAASAYNVLVSSLTASIGNPGSFDKQEWLESVEKARKVVPQELADDFDVLATAYGKAADALESIGDFDTSDPQAASDPNYIAAMTAAGEALNDTETQAIGQRLTDYFANECS